MNSSYKGKTSEAMFMKSTSQRFACVTVPAASAIKEKSPKIFA
jgi:hypothetical protein